MPLILGTLASAVTGNLVNGAFESIQTINISSNTATVTFSSIPSTYKHLQIRMISRTDQFSVPGLRVRFNGDTASNYALHRLAGNSTSAFSQSGSSQTNIGMYGPGGGGTTANMFGANIIDILDYTSTNKNKTLRSIGGADYNGGGQIGLYSGLWMNSSTAISSIYLECDTLFVANSTLALYGVK